MKRIVCVLLAALSIACLASCAVHFSSSSDQEQKSEVEQTIIVYDENDEKILETTDKAILEKFSDYASQETVEGMEIFEPVPEDAQLAYRFILKDHSEYEVTMEVYQNYDYLSIQDLPILNDIRLELSKEEAEWFRMPEKW